MKRIGLWLALAVGMVLPAHGALALGEIFKVETSGTEFCGDFDTAKFSAKNNGDLWVRIDSTEQITMSFTPDFADGTTFPMFGFTYQTGRGKSAFVGGVGFDNGAYVTMQGSVSWDPKTGEVKKLSGTFIQSEVASAGCFSSGKFTTQKP